MAPLITVLIPTIPERVEMLKEAVASVDAQTCRDFNYLIGHDDYGHGCAANVNRLAWQTDAEWLMILADDDLMLPGCLAAHMLAQYDADVVYSPPLVWGRPDVQHFHGEPPAIPSLSLIRMNLWRSLSGYDENLKHMEDRDFYTRALQVGARFRRVDHTPTWVYRFHGENKSQVAR